MECSSTLKRRSDREERLDIYSRISDQVNKAINTDDKEEANELLEEVLQFIDKLVYLEDF